MNELEKFINRFILLSAHELKIFKSLFMEISIKQGDFFAAEGKPEKNIGFLLHGVIRAFYRNTSGLEYNKTFFTDNEFFGPYASLITKQNNQINIQALTDCQILVANYQEISALFDVFPKIERLARMLAEFFYVYKEKREIELVLLNAEERYKLFKQEYPSLENLIPQYHIASYLGITPTQLSRIRAKK